MMTHPTATIMKEQIDEFNECNESNPFLVWRAGTFEVEQWGWRYWRFLEDTPYTLGEINLAGWNSYEEMVKGKKAFRTITRTNARNERQARIDNEEDE